MTGGMVTYGDRNGELRGCTYSSGGLTHAANPDQSPSERSDGFDTTVFPVFDTTVFPVEYHGVAHSPWVIRHASLAGAKTSLGRVLVYPASVPAEAP